MEIREGRYPGGINIGIVTDLKQEAVREVVRETVEDTMNKNGYTCCLSFFYNLREAAESKVKPDIVVWHMGKPDEKILELKYAFPKLICLASGMKYVKTAFQIGAFRYIRLSELTAELEEALEDAADEIQKEQGLEIITDGTYRWILFEDIYYIEALGDDIVIYTENEYVVVRKTMNYVQERLGKDFFRCHRAFIVNFSRIREADGQNILLVNGKSIPISFRRKKDFFIEYQRYGIKG